MVHPVSDMPISTFPYVIVMESDFEMGVREFLAKEPFCFRGLTKDQMTLFCSALTHDSYSNEARDMDPPRIVESYERLEFLGDAVLEFLVCEIVYRSTNLKEGAMTDYKQDKVCNHMISERLLTKGVDVDRAMRVGLGHMGHAGSKKIEENMRADSFEALIGAIYLTFGMDKAREIVIKTLID